MLPVFIFCIFEKKNMKDLIIKALKEAHASLLQEVPTTKPKEVCVVVTDVPVTVLLNFLRQKDFPPDAKIGVNSNGRVQISYTSEQPMSEADKEKYKRDIFHEYAFKFVYDILIINGYRKKSLDTLSGERRWDKIIVSGKMFMNINIYDCYINKDFETIVSLYSSLYFEKE